MSDMSGGDFTLPDANGQAPTDLNTLFGFNQAVGKAPILLRRGERRITSIGTLHETADETTTLAQAAQSFYGMDPSALANLQQQLYAAGLYGDSYYSGKTPKLPQVGTADEDSFAAFKKALVRAARSGQQLDDVLHDSIASFQTSGAGGTARAPFAAQVTNPTDIRKVVEAAAKKTYGQKADQGLVDRIVGAFQAEETRAQKAAYDVAPTGGTVTAAPDLGAFTEDQLRRANSAAAAAHDTSNTFSQFEQLLRASGNG